MGESADNARTVEPPVHIEVRTSIVLELAWATYFYDDESEYPAREALLGSVPGFRDRISAFWEDGDACLTEAVVLANQAGVLFSTDPERVWAGLEAAAAAEPRDEQLSSESASTQIQIRSRIARLNGDPDLRRRWLERARYIWECIAPGWEREGRCAVEAAERDLRSSLPEWGAVSDVERLTCHDWDGLLQRLVRDAATARAEVTVVPAWLGRKGLIISLADRLVIGPLTPRRPAGPSPATRDRARRLKALGDPTRLALFEAVAQRPRTVGMLAQEMGLAQPTVSNHVRILRDAGLLSQEKGEGRRLQADLDAFTRLLDEARRSAVRPAPGITHLASEASTL